MSRKEIFHFQDVPNVGNAIEAKLYCLGICSPIQLIGKDPYKMYNDLCTIKNKQCDPCVLDVFISAVSFMEGGPPKKWWKFTEERKNRLAAR